METLASFTQATHSGFPCLLGAFEGICGYYTNQPVSFSLGEAIASFGIIFAVYQLQKTSWQIRGAIQGWLRNLIWIFGGLGLFFILLAVLVSNIPIGMLETPWSIPLFYELIGFLFFVCSPLSLVVFGTRRKLFNKYTAQRFYQSLHYNIMRGGTDRLEACVDIITQNLQCLLKTIASNKNQESTQYALYVFNVLLSEKRVAQYIATERMDFIGYLFFLLKEIPIENSRDITYIKRGTNKIFRELFQEENSVLYTQLDYDGLSLSANLYDLIFADNTLVSNYNPFSDAGVGSNPLGINVFIKAFNASVKAYLTEKREYLPEHLASGFSSMEKHIRGLCSSVATDGKTIKEIESNISRIVRFYGHDFPQMLIEARSKNLLADFNKRLSDEDYSKGLSEIYVSSLYELVESLAVLNPTEKDEWYVYQILIEAYYSTLFHDELPDIKDKLLELIWKQIEEKNLKGFYPSVLRVYLSIFPWWSPDDQYVAPIIITEKARAKDLLEKLKPRLLTEEKMSNKQDLLEKVLLPQSISFSKEENTFYYRDNFNQKIKII